MITHNEIVTVLGAALSLVVFMLGYWRGHYRAYAECCDCCTCQTCTEGGRSEDSALWSDDLRTDTLADVPSFAAADSQDFGGRDQSSWPTARRHAVVLEPGPTIYPALAELAGEVMDGPHSDPEPTTSTWLMERRLWMEDRYPIPVGAP